MIPKDTPEIRTPWLIRTLVWSSHCSPPKWEHIWLPAVPTLELHVPQAQVLMKHSPIFRPTVFFYKIKPPIISEWNQISWKWARKCVCGLQLESLVVQDQYKQSGLSSCRLSDLWQGHPEPTALPVRQHAEGDLTHRVTRGWSECSQHHVLWHCRRSQHRCKPEKFSREEGMHDCLTLCNW